MELLKMIEVWKELIKEWEAKAELAEQANNMEAHMVFLYLVENIAKDEIEFLESERKGD